MAVTIDDLKVHANALGDVPDSILTRKFAVAREMVAQKVGGFDQFEGTIPAPLEEAILMYAAHLLANREATTFGGQAFLLPIGVEDLIGPRRAAWSY